ncbi:salicylic acid-binding protein [Trifolium repens]|nr:salicylic acid-binding protein [Trifolium repens]
MDTIPPNEKVILVGHSLGGLNIALAMEKFPDKIVVGVFLTAFAPDIGHDASYVLGKHIENAHAEAWLDTEHFPSGSKTQCALVPNSCPISSINYPPLRILNWPRFYQGQVPHVFIVCDDDLAIPLKFQHWMIQNAGINDVFEIKGTDHMPMLCKPQELCDSLNQISIKYE